MAYFMASFPTVQHARIITPRFAPRARAQSSSKCDSRRAFLYGLVTAGAGTLLAPEIASAAKRRPPAPPPTEEKTDPNISGVQAKILASKKRKEAMKEAVARMREKGKAIEK